MLFGYYNRAVEDYSQAILRNPEFAEAYYNRGIAHLKNYEMIDGCQDLAQSADLGYEQAAEKQRFFCVE